jgi:adenylylsulfate kinase
MIIVMAGLPATGKSTLAKALADHLSGTVLNKDIIRHAVFDSRDADYSTQQDDFCMEIMLQAADYILRKDPIRYIFLDGRTFSRRHQLDRVIGFAKSLHQPWRILECTCSDKTAKTRLGQATEHPAGNRDFALYQEVKRRFEPITLPKTVVDTGMPLENCIASALQALKT